MKKLTYTDMLADLGITSAHPGGSFLTKKILTKESITPDKKILDVGCGTGQTAVFLAKTYKCDVIAIDAHTTMIRKAKKRFEKNELPIKLIKANAEKLPFSDEIFDFITAESVIAFTQTSQSLPEMVRVLKKAGRLISIEMTAENNLSEDEKKEITEVYGIERVFTEEEWKEEFLRAGFTEVMIEEDHDRPKEFIGEKNDPSNYIDPNVFEILQTHSSLLEKLNGRLGYRIFRCLK
ncbi:class I SAM-dependent methyltransferase [Anaerobacillus alkaliphilus]|uniref:Class I SAM-dependent methyltransferase n=1 Tax=Anaerobacillus alkaliphilus TaxID=1548597 RepID=A0A4Q0VVU4_9BACI|nr:class I SAM-dependent methyltransferase [Anaerobacillus alkaliphilus]RXJ03813.1 class I SAM-dependent methyltransferase [Anaerobacillus alkaliphilus]